ncbi:MAG TPA: hypothetical protein VN253_19705 [Kofleriaceae bacterium]|nr:hypothetical protein [Kofleriaceae bacterium]
MPNARSLAVLLLAATTVAPACGSSDCDKIYDTLMKCSKGDKDKAPSKNEFSKMCEDAKAKNKEEFEATATCAKEDSCEKMEECEKGQRGKRRAKKVAEATAAGKWRSAFDDCTTFEDYYADEAFKTECNKVFANADKLTGEDAAKAMTRCKYSDKVKKVAPDFEKACKSLASGQLAAATKAATAARDAGKRDYKTCSELKDVAGLAGGDAVAAAQKLCDEVDAAEEAKKGADEARANAAAKKTSMPYQCDSAAEKLEKLGTEWSKKTLDDLLKACYVELGAVVIEEKGKDAKYVCPYEITKVTEAIAKRDLATKFPELAELTKKLPKQCTKK